MSLRNLRATEIIDAIAAAAGRWADADYPARLRSLSAIVERTRYSLPVVEYALDTLFSSITREALNAAVVGELGSLETLDGFVARNGRPDVFFRGVDEITIVSSQTTIGVAIPPLLFAACAKSNVVVKDRNDGLVAAFGKTLVEERAEFSESISVERWEGHDDPRALERFAMSDVVVAFGGAEALTAIRARMRADARFVPFGHRTSIGYVTREALADEGGARACAAGAARDALLYDGEGCLSSHAVFVERGGKITFERFVDLVRQALEAATIEFPADAREPAPATVAARDAARFRASQGRGQLAVGSAGGYLLLSDPPAESAPPIAPRTLALYPIDAPADAVAFLRRHRLPFEGFATVPLPRGDVIELAIASGAVRIARLGELQAARLEAEHGGVGRILPFVRAITKDR